MKKILILLSILVIPALIYAGVKDTAHDFSSNLGGGNDMTACGGCHKPHNAGTLIPLWNDDNKFDDQAYSTYSSPTDALNVDNGTANYPSSITGTISEACMACHDGMVESVGFDLDNPGTTKLTSTITVGLVLEYTNNPNGQHPVHIRYFDNATADPIKTNLKPITSAKADGMKFYTYNGTSDWVECGSCHDPHNDTYGDFLRASKATLCQSCHNN